MWQKPELIFVCGCNGAGKSTLTRAAHCLEKGYALLDPDRISLVSNEKSINLYIVEIIEFQHQSSRANFCN